MILEFGKNKRHYCSFCQKFKTQIIRHFRQRHSDQEVVAEIVQLEEKLQTKITKIKESKHQIDAAWEAFRNENDHKSNLETIEKKKGILIVARNPAEDEPLNWQHYSPCPFCLAWMLKNQLGFHEPRCKNKPKDLAKAGKSSLVKKSKRLVFGSFKNEHSEELLEIISTLSDDEIANTIRDDKSILQVGQDLLNQQARKKEHYKYIKDRLRELGRLLLELRSHKGNEKRKLSSFIRVEEWPLIIKTIKKMALNLNKNTLARKLGYDLMKVADIYWEECTANRNFREAKEVFRFQEMYKKTFTKKIGSLAVKKQYDAHLNKEQKMASDSDVKKFNNGLKDDLTSALESFKDHPNERDYFLIQKLTLVFLIVYNRKRAGEVAKCKLKNFLDSKIGDYGKQQTVIDKLSKLEQAIIDKHHLMRIVGKKGRHVSVLIPELLKDAMDILVECRDYAKIDKKNDYLFCKANMEGYLNPWPVISSLSKKYNLDHPETIRSTNLRKHLATSLLSLNVAGNDLERIATFMVSLLYFPCFGGFLYNF